MHKVTTQAHNSQILVLLGDMNWLLSVGVLKCVVETRFEQATDPHTSDIQPNLQELAQFPLVDLACQNVYIADYMKRN